MMKRILPALLLAGLLVSSGTQAATLSFSNAEQPTPISQTGTLDLFDSSIGTLQSVKLTLFGTGSSTFSLTNANTDSRNITAGSRIDLFVSSSLASLNTTLDSLLPALTLNTSTGPITIDSGLTTLSAVPSSQSLELSLDPSIFAFVGGGSFSLYCENTDGKSLQGQTSGVSLSLSTRAGCGASVVYDFIPNPPAKVSEPASLALLGIGLMGVLANRRRKLRG